MKIAFTGLSDRGKKRETNQDSILMHTDDTNGFYLFVVADGMGGYTDGEKASKAITQGLQQWAEGLFDSADVDRTHLSRVGERTTLRLDATGKDQDFETDDRPSVDRMQLSFAEIRDSLKDELHKINSYVYRELNRGQICGSTVVALFLYRETYGVVSAGDSRIYMLNRGGAKSVIPDDVWENQRSVIASTTARQRRKSDKRGILVNSIGPMSKVNLNVVTGPMKSKEAYLLCSDGVYKYCPHYYLELIMRVYSFVPLEKLKERLLKKVYQNGAKDNASAILVLKRD